MLSNELVEQAWHKQGKAPMMDQRVPRVAKMLELYEEPLWMGGKFGGAEEADGKEEMEWWKHVVWYKRKE